MGYHLNVVGGFSSCLLDNEAKNILYPICEVLKVEINLIFLSPSTNGACPRCGCDYHVDTVLFNDKMGNFRAGSSLAWKEALRV